MLYDFIRIDKDKGLPLYRQIYISIRENIENGSLKKGTRLPSIRRLSEDLKASKTTILAAYDQLCTEGYIRNKPQSGYYVEAEFESIPKSAGRNELSEAEGVSYYEYDFRGRNIDQKVINISEWKKYVKDVLNQSYMMSSYGEAQGEEILRQALQKYSLGTRSVNTDAENIIVGAGMQPLLFLLCAILDKKGIVAVERSGYPQAELVFLNTGCEVKYYDCDESGATVNSLSEIRPDIIVINPNYTGNKGNAMPITRRLEIIEYAKSNNAIIIEDDYNGELRYSTHPIPCMQHYDTENTVYLGSFSKVLLPSVRISYMALPERLMIKYNAIKSMVNQTASKAEQIALAKYILNRKIDIHLRKARRIYLEKSRVLLESLEKYFSDKEIIFNETSLYAGIRFDDIKDKKRLVESLKEKSISVMERYLSENIIGISFSGIDIEKIDMGIHLLSDELNKI